VHEQTTGPELWAATNGRVDVLVSGVGTGGTITGISRYWERGRGQPLHSVAVEPATSPVLSQRRRGEALQPGAHKIQGIGAGFVPDVLDLALVDAIELVGDDEAMDTARRLARDEGILAGISCGAAAAVASRLARRPEHAGQTIAVILPDSGERYLSTTLFADVLGEGGGR
jgi:cysteine synthase A